MCFGVGKPATTRQTSWARLITYSYCSGLTGHHQGSHPLSAMSRGWICCSSFYVMPQRMIPSSQDCDLYGLTLSTPWVSRDFRNAFLKIVTKNMAHSWGGVHLGMTSTASLHMDLCEYLGMPSPVNEHVLWVRSSCWPWPVVLKIVCHHVSALFVRTTDLV